MPFDCRYKEQHGHDVCLEACPALDSRDRVRFETWTAPEQARGADARTVDVFVLDMNHGWPNLGHGAIVHAVRNVACDLADELHALDVRLRVVSCDVRLGHVIPPPPGEAGAVYVGTGGPGHLDPRRNDGVAEWTQGVVERPEWEAPLFALFDRIRAHPEAALFGVCHTFGVMCRWLGAAEPRLRDAARGGKRVGVHENVLTPTAQRHPWFGPLATSIAAGEHLRVLESRLFDLVPPRSGLPEGVSAIGYEGRGPHGFEDSALTMIEVERDRAGVVPRVLAVNHHPEIVNRPRQVTILKERLRRGDVTEAWYAERLALLTQTMPDEDSDHRLRVTSTYTLLAPLRYHVIRQVRLRAEAFGRTTALHEEAVRLSVVGPVSLRAGEAS